MKFSSSDIEILEILAGRVEVGAKLATAKAEESKMHGDGTTYVRQTDRAAFGTLAVVTLRRVIKQCREIERRASGNRPTLQEVRAEWDSYALSKKSQRAPADEIEGWFNHFESNGWLVSGKTAMKDWKAACRTGYLRWQKTAPAAGGAAATVAARDADSPGWREFLLGKGIAYRQQRYAPQDLREEFNRK